MSPSKRDDLDGELLEVSELIWEWKEDFGPDFLTRYVQVIQTFRDGYPEDADYAEDRLRTFLADVGMGLP